MKSIVPLNLFCFSMTLFYFIVSGYVEPTHIFFRASNCICVLLVICCSLLIRMKNFSKDCRIRVCFDITSALALLLYSFTSLLTYERCYSLLSAFVTLSSANSLHSVTGFSEGHGMLLTIMGVLVMANFRVATGMTFVVISLAGPIIWVLQIGILGTALDTTSMIKLMGTYAFLSMLLCHFVFRMDNERLDEFVRLHSERSEMIHIMRHAAVPIFFTSLEKTTGQVRIQMWNNILADMTHKIAEGTLLRDVTCMHPAQAENLAKAVKRTLSKPEDRAQRMLLQLFGGAGHVWLQIDAWPVQHMGLKAIVIGSDVTEFVDRHRSLLWHVPEESVVRDEKYVPHTSSNRELSAAFDPTSMLLRSCSPNFNVFFKRRMDAQNFLDFVFSQDQSSLREVVTLVAQGGASQDVEVGLLVSQVRSLRRRRRDRDSFGRAVPVPVRITISDDDEDNGTHGFLRLVISDCDCERDSSAPEAQSDPGEFVELRGNHQRQAKSEGSFRLGEAGVSKQKEAQASLVSAEGADGAFGVQEDELLVHMLCVLRHLAPSFDHAMNEIVKLVDVLAARSEHFRQIFGTGCNGWKCTSCNALNDSDDTDCFICGGTPSTGQAGIEDASRSHKDFPVVRERRAEVCIRKPYQLTERGRAMPRNHIAL